MQYGTGTFVAALVYGSAFAGSAVHEFQHQKIDFPPLSLLEAVHGRPPEILAERPPPRKLPSPAQKQVSLLMVMWERGEWPFGLLHAQRLAEHEVLMVFGEGSATFRERIGAVWIFRTNLGYAGRPGPNLAVIDPARSPPIFAVPENWPNQALRPTPGNPPQNGDAPRSGVAHL